jgi:hypothetical protein
MATKDHHEQARQWSGLLVSELLDNLRYRWAKGFADRIADELWDELAEDFQDMLPLASAEYLADELAERMRVELRNELQQAPPERIRELLQEEIEEVVFQQLIHGQDQHLIHWMVEKRELELAEDWARIAASELTKKYFRQLTQWTDERRPAHQRASIQSVVAGESQRTEHTSTAVSRMRR